MTEEISKRDDCHDMEAKEARRPLKKSAEFSF